VGIRAAPIRSGATGCPGGYRGGRELREDLAEIKSDVRLLKWISGTTLAGVLALVIRTFTS
jgi:hypothetical protein